VGDDFRDLATPPPPRRMLLRPERWTDSRSEGAPGRAGRGLVADLVYERGADCVARHSLARNTHDRDGLSPPPGSRVRAAGLPHPARDGSSRRPGVDRSSRLATRARRWRGRPGPERNEPVSTRSAASRHDIEEEIELGQDVVKLRLLALDAAVPGTSRALAVARPLSVNINGERNRERACSPRSVPFRC
jgi:hypothetical protein